MRVSFFTKVKIKFNNVIDKFFLKSIVLYSGVSSLGVLAAGGVPLADKLTLFQPRGGRLCRDAAGLSNPGGLAVMWWA